MVVVEPGLEAGAVEEVTAGEAVHHGLRLEPDQADAAVGRRRRGAATPPAEARRAEPAPEPLRQAGPRRELLLVVVVALAVLPGQQRRRRRQAEEHEHRSKQACQGGDRDHRVEEQVDQEALLGRRHAGDAHRGCVFDPAVIPRRDWGSIRAFVDSSVISASFGGCGAVDAREDWGGGGGGGGYCERGGEPGPHL